LGNKNGIAMKYIILGEPEVNYEEGLKITIEERIENI